MKIISRKQRFTQQIAFVMIVRLSESASHLKLEGDFWKWRIIVENEAAHWRHIASPLEALRAIKSMPKGASTTGHIWRLLGFDRFFATQSFSPWWPSKALTSAIDVMISVACVGFLVLHLFEMVVIEDAPSTAAAPWLLRVAAACVVVVSLLVVVVLSECFPLASTFRTSFAKDVSVRLSAGESNSTFNVGLNNGAIDNSGSTVKITVAPKASASGCFEKFLPQLKLSRRGGPRLTMWCSSAVRGNSNSCPSSISIKNPLTSKRLMKEVWQDIVSFSLRRNWAIDFKIYEN